MTKKKPNSLKNKNKTNPPPQEAVIQISITQEFRDLQNVRKTKVIKDEHKMQKV